MEKTIKKENKLIENFKIYLWLFKVNFFISAFTFGGGYVVIPMIRKYFVEGKGYFSEEELLNLSAIAQSSPGAIAVNLAVLAGYKTKGLVGAIISGVAAVTPPIIILSIVSYYYEIFRNSRGISAILKGMEAGVAALIVELVVDMSRIIFNEKSKFLSFLVPFAFVLSIFFRINAGLIILICSILCFGKSWIMRR